jgi:hypothetical protein
MKVGHSAIESVDGLSIMPRRMVLEWGANDIPESVATWRDAWEENASH